jgi:hypothetical protein
LDLSKSSIAVGQFGAVIACAGVLAISNAKEIKRHGEKPSLEAAPGLVRKRQTNSEYSFSVIDSSHFSTGDWRERLSLSLVECDANPVLFTPHDTAGQVQPIARHN